MTSVFSWQNSISLCPASFWHTPAPRDRRNSCTGTLPDLCVSSSSYSSVCFIFLIFKIYLAMAVLCLHCCEGSCLVVTSGGYSLVVVCWLLITVASLAVEHRV